MITKTEPTELTCPGCGESFLDSPGYCEGPREYHAECWYRLTSPIAPARGIVIGALLGLAIWGLLGAAIWLLWGG